VSKAYRLWKPSTKTVIKARDVKFVESTSQIDRMRYQRKSFMYHTLNFDNNEAKNNYESLTENDGEMIDQNKAECSDPNE